MNIENNKKTRDYSSIWGWSLKINTFHNVPGRAKEKCQKSRGKWQKRVKLSI